MSDFQLSAPSGVLNTNAPAVQANSGSLSILFITPATPFAQNSGTEQRSTLMYQALAKLGTVDVLQLSEGSSDQAPTRIDASSVKHIAAQCKQRNNVLTRYRPKYKLSQAIELALDRTFESYDLIVGRYLWPICQIDIPSQIPAIVDLDDFHYRYSVEVPWTPKLVLERLKKFLAHQMAKSELKRFRGAYLVSELDRHDVEGLHTQVLPNIPWTINQAPSRSSPSKTLLFVGSLWYRPNADGINWFLRHVWPDVLRAEPEAHLNLVGAAPKSTRLTWEKNTNVHALGFVDDISAVYKDASVVIIPVHSGGGSNIKLLESLGHACPCVATPFTAALFGDVLRPGEHFLVAETAEQFRDQIVSVLGSPNQCEVIGKTGYRLVASHFTHEMFAQNVIALANTMSLRRRCTQKDSQ